MNWKTIRLELAATADFPKGSVGRGFLIRAPIDPEGRIDESAVMRAPGRATVRRVWPNEPDQRGQLVRVDGNWVLRCDGEADRMIDLAATMRSGNEVLVSSGDEQTPFRVRIFG